MPRSMFHTIVLTDDLEGVITFLHEVVGMEPVRRFGDEVGSRTQAEQVFGWPADAVTIDGAVIGSGTGMIEVLAIPESLRHVEKPRVAFMTFATPEVERYADRARDAGFEVGPIVSGDGVVSTFTLSQVSVGGLDFEFIRFGSTD